MADATSSPTPSSIGSDLAAAETVLVSFENDISAAAEFTDAPPSEWAFAAHEAAFDGEAIDAVSEPDSARLLPLVAVATMAIAEADLYTDAEDALVAMTPAPFAFDVTSNVRGAGADGAMVMWRGESSEDDGVAEPVAVCARGELGLAPNAIASHGISLDWTDTLLV